jgi:putative spermidine/putrescine transport system permease protein
VAEAILKSPEPQSEPILTRLARWRPRWLTWNWIGVLPFFLFIVVFQLYPTLSIAIGAITDDHNHVVLDYMATLGQQLYLSSYLNTLKISLITTVSGGLLGFLLAWSITIGRLPQSIRAAVLSFCGVASNFAGVPLALAFISALGRVGVLTQVLKSFGIVLYPDFSLSSIWGICLTYTYFQIPFMVLIMTPALDGLRQEWREAAENLGATRFQYWRDVLLPILLPSLLSSLALLFANAFGAYATAFALVGGGAGENLVVSIMVRAQFSNDSLTNPHLGNALAFGMVIVIGITVFVYTVSRQQAERWRRAIN